MVEGRFRFVSSLLCSWFVVDFGSVVQVQLVGVFDPFVAGRSFVRFAVRSSGAVASRR